MSITNHYVVEIGYGERYYFTNRAYATQVFNLLADAKRVLSSKHRLDKDGKENYNLPPVLTFKNSSVSLHTIAVDTKDENPF